ncbi:MAG: CoB--CoM heterodisulfide reductase iron-sulfur subunit A family protein [Deltaproteobacteria bacterium]|nr:CoB--CoM heterodisulfide reductase iron-sulfur subunit A family protein [Deltaproteobacteria bacterium]
MANISVFLCKCFGEIDNTVDFDFLRKELSKNPSIVLISTVDSLCLETDIEKTVSRIKESNSEKVLIAACSILSRGNLVVESLIKEGIERHKIGLVDIREGCAWIHGDDPAGVTKKAKDLINIGIAALQHKELSDDMSVTVHPNALIIGAGPAGLAAAISLAKTRFKVNILERSKAPGGMLRLISRCYPGNEDASNKLEPYIREVENNPLITFYPQSKIASIEGDTGNFTVHFSSQEKDSSIKSGVIIIATGAKIFFPTGLYGYGEIKNVITQMEFERQILNGSLETKKPVFIQCVGARDKKRPYCSTICCPISLKNASRIAEDVPGASVFILHRGIMTPGNTLEKYYRDTLASGVQFIRFEEEHPPRIIGSDHVESVEVYDAITGITRKIETDLVVLSTPLVPNNDNAQLAKMMDIEVDRYGFFSEIYPMHPLETKTDGIFICGSARWPVSSDNSILQGKAAAMKAVSYLRQSKITASTLSRVPGLKAGHARVVTESCTGCGNCVAACPFNACHLEKMEGRYISVVNMMKCKACGSCVSVCPNGSVQIPEHNYRMVGEMIKMAF